MLSTKIKVMAAVVVLLFGAGVYVRGVYDAPVKMELKAATNKTAAISAARAVEHTVIASDVKESAEYQKGLQDGKKELQGSIDDLRARIERMRHNTNNSARMPGIASPTGGRDGQARGDIFGANESSIVGAIEQYGIGQYKIASEADDIVKQLTACQNVLASRNAAVPDSPQ